LFALPMSPDELEVYRRCTGRTEPPAAPAPEGWLVCGRRSGKSFTLAMIAVFLACFRDWRPQLAPGEVATIMVIAVDRKQARVILRYIRALLSNVPMLARMIARETAESFDLNNHVSIEVQSASFRSTRGYAICAALVDELAYFRTDDAAEPDYEILAAIRPGMAQFDNAMLLCASSPYARKGAVWDAHRKHFGQEHDPVLVWQAPTRSMNPTVPQRVIDEATAADPANAAAEYGATFRSDIESFVSRQVIEAAVVPGRYELPPVSGVSYHGFVDPAGGSGADSITLCIAHRDKDGRTVLDAVRETRPPFSPESVVQEFAGLLKSYRVYKVVGDRWGGEFVREPFRSHGVQYELATKTKSDFYRDVLATFNSGRIELLDHPKLIAQLCGLERRTARGGRDSIDHAPNAHDDLANAVAGVAAALATPGYNSDYAAWVFDAPGTNDGHPAFCAPRTNVMDHPIFQNNPRSMRGGWR
jgi:hypothetical protein